MDTTVAFVIQQMAVMQQQQAAQAECVALQYQNQYAVQQRAAAAQQQALFAALTYVT